jgi:dimethylargininase
VARADVRFTRAIVRPPPATFRDGITTSGLGPPDLTLALEQHAGYCRTLERLGLSLIRLSPDPAFPDSTFVEDAAVVTARGAILTCPGAPSRVGEVVALRAALAHQFSRLDEIASPGTVDGGDVCEAGQHYFIGVSRRTNVAGAAQVAECLARQGFDSSLIDIRGMEGLLHLKTGLSWLGERRLLATGAIADQEALKGWEVVRVPAGEEYAANCIGVNGALLVAEGFPLTGALLAELGYEVLSLAMSEYQKMDGGPSCLSVRW